MTGFILGVSIYLLTPKVFGTAYDGKDLFFSLLTINFYFS